MRKGDKVNWNWGKYQAEGTVKEKYTATIEKKIKGSNVKRKASKEEPAYLVVQQNGKEAIKSESELKKGHKHKHSDKRSS